MEETTGIGRNDCLAARIEKMGDFTIAQLLGWLGLDEIVHTCGATTKRGFGNLGNLQLRNFKEEFAGLLVDSLSVTKMACVVIGDAEGKRMTRSYEGYAA